VNTYEKSLRHTHSLHTVTRKNTNKHIHTIQAV
jgi:hypothetical protein